jgi:hypothetical protein
MTLSLPFAVERRPASAPAVDNRRVLAVALGRFHTVALVGTRESPLVYTWGSPQGGRLGYPGLVPVRQPRLVISLSDKEVQQIAAGPEHSVFLSTARGVFVCGVITEPCQLDEPTRIATLSSFDSPVVQIGAGNGYTGVVTEDRTVALWPGRDSDITPPNASHHAPKVAYAPRSASREVFFGYSSFAVLADDGSAVIVPTSAPYTPAPLPVSGPADAGHDIALKQVALGATHFAALVQTSCGPSFSSLCPVDARELVSDDAVGLDAPSSFADLSIHLDGSPPLACHRVFLHTRLGEFRVSDLPPFVRGKLPDRCASGKTDRR